MKRWWWLMRLERAYSNRQEFCQMTIYLLSRTVEGSSGRIYVD